MWFRRQKVAISSALLCRCGLIEPTEILHQPSVASEARVRFRGPTPAPPCLLANIGNRAKRVPPPFRAAVSFRLARELLRHLPPFEDLLVVRLEPERFGAGIRGVAILSPFEGCVSDDDPGVGVGAFGERLFRWAGDA